MHEYHFLECMTSFHYALIFSCNAWYFSRYAWISSRDEWLSSRDACHVFRNAWISSHDEWLFSRSINFFSWNAWSTNDYISCFAQLSIRMWMFGNVKLSLGFALLTSLLSTNILIFPSFFANGTTLSNQDGYNVTSTKWDSICFYNIFFNIQT